MVLASISLVSTPPVATSAPLYPLLPSILNSNFFILDTIISNDSAFDTIEPTVSFSSFNGSKIGSISFLLMKPCIHSSKGFLLFFTKLFLIKERNCSWLILGIRSMVNIILFLTKSASITKRLMSSMAKPERP